MNLEPQQKIKFNMMKESKNKWADKKYVRVFNICTLALFNKFNSLKINRNMIFY